MTPQELADEILPKIEEAYKDVVLVYASRLTEEDRERGGLIYQQSKLGEIRVILPIPRSLMQDATISAVAELVGQRDFIARAGELEENVLLDNDGKAILNCYQQDLVALEVFCKPLIDVRLA